MPGGNPSSAVGDGRKVVTTAGTAERLVTQPVAGGSICITALEGNTDVVVIGGSTVVAALATRRGTPLQPEESVTFTTDGSILFIDAMVSGEGVSFSFEAR